MTRKNSLKAVLSLAVCGWAFSAHAAEISTNTALMQAMDKVTGRVSKITVPVNSKLSYGDFSLVLRACKKRPAEETPENFAFIDVADKSFGEDEYNIFRGWIVSSTPGINAIEHPIYDVWLLECINEEVDKTKLLSKEELQARDSLRSKDDVIAKVEPEIREIGETIIDSGSNPKRVIRIKEFTVEERDIEKDIREEPAYISESSASYVSDIEEGDEPENLLQFTRMQEVKEEAEKAPAVVSADDKELNAAIEAEIKGLKN